MEELFPSGSFSISVYHALLSQLLKMQKEELALVWIYLPMSKKNFLFKYSFSYDIISPFASRCMLLSLSKKMLLFLFILIRKEQKLKDEIMHDVNKILKQVFSNKVEQTKCRTCFAELSDSFFKR